MKNPATRSSWRHRPCPLWGPRRRLPSSPRDWNRSAGPGQRRRAGGRGVRGARQRARPSAARPARLHDGLGGGAAPGRGRAGARGGERARPQPRPWRATATGRVAVASRSSRVGSGSGGRGGGRRRWDPGAAGEQGSWRRGWPRSWAEPLGRAERRRRPRGPARPPGPRPEPWARPRSSTTWMGRRRRTW